MSTEDQNPTTPAEKTHGILGTIKDVAKKAVDATILNTHPSGGNIDGRMKLDGEFVKDVVHATVLNDHPSGAPIGAYTYCHRRTSVDVMWTPGRKTFLLQLLFNLLTEFLFEKCISLRRAFSSTNLI
jgi:hypothetical protein